MGEIDDVHPEQSIEPAESAKDEQMFFAQERGARIALLILLREQRRIYAKVAYWIMGDWLVFVASVLVLCGAHTIELSESVLTALVAGSSANVIGLAGAVMLSLFPRKGIEVPAEGPPLSA